MPLKDRIFQTFLKTIKNYRLLSPGDHILLLVSGGSDSMSLLSLFHLLSVDWSLRLTVLHFNHGLRESAGEDARLVEKHCAHLDIDFILRELPVLKFAGDEKISIEEAGSRLRREASVRAASRLSADRIATGHTKDDQAETVIMRLLRGAGTAGLSGIRTFIPPYFIRPLLFLEKNELINFCVENKIPYNEDMTNLDISITRNMVRHKILPFLYSENPSLLNSLLHTALLCAGDDSYMEDTAGAEFDRIARSVEDTVILPVEELSTLHPAISARLVRRCVLELTGTLRDLSFPHVAGVLSLTKSLTGKKSVLPPEIEVIRKGDELVFRKMSESRGEIPSPSGIELPGDNFLPDWGIMIRGEIIEEPGKPPTSAVIPALLRRSEAKTNPPVIPAKAGIQSTAEDSGKTSASAVFLNAEKMKELEIRAVKLGDVFSPPGFKGKKKVKKFLMEKKIYREERKIHPLLTSGDKIIWIIGYNVDAGFLPVSGEPVMKITVEKIRQMGDDQNS